MKKITAIFMCAMLIFVFCGCKNDAPPELWKEATYLTDKSFGEGSKEVVVEVSAGGKSVNFTIKSDEVFLGDALLEHDLIRGEDGEYGLFIMSVNGIMADYDIDQTYWAFYKNGEYMMTGVDATEFFDGEHYELVREK